MRSIFLSHTHLCHVVRSWIAGVAARTLPVSVLRLVYLSLYIQEAVHQADGRDATFADYSDVSFASIMITLWPKPVAGANRRWRGQFRYRGSRRESAVAQLFSLGKK